MNAALPPKSLGKLLAGLAELPRDVVVSDLVQDGRAAHPGCAFLAVRGTNEHGLKYAPQAVANGARAVLWEPAPSADVPDLPSDIVVAPVAHLREHVSEIADRFYGAPSTQLSIAGITGTNGKTTCAWLLAQALELSGRAAAYMGTIGIGRPASLVASALTTGDAVTVQRTLASLRADGAANVAMEVSSHALDQFRVAAVRFRTAAFTNLTRDHLDYHGTMDAYGAAKSRLFTREHLRSRVINVDDAFGRQLAIDPRGRGRLIVTSRGHQTRVRNHDGFVRAMHVSFSSRGIELEFDSSWGAGALRCPLIGDFNVDNLLTVIAILLDWDTPLDEVLAVLSRVRATPGRMETFGGGGLPLAVVDYAHTPDALQKALSAARVHTAGRLVVVFGCGGDRDAGKRPVMGGIAAELADDIVITDDNPRTESPQAIADGVSAGIPAGKPFRVQLDRARAIREALEQAHADDVVVIAGKGHEDYQVYGAERRPFSDQQVVRDVLGVMQNAGVAMKRTLSWFAQASGGELVGADREYTGVSSDTRTIKPGELFVALRGPRFNANEFVEAAANAGAAGALVDTRVDTPLPQVLVKDTLQGLQASSAAWRAHFSLPVIGVAGSNGKTTCKEMTAAILSRAGATLHTRGSLNNHIGVPLTLHRLDATHRFAVIEVGTNHPGEVEALCKLARPTVGLITNAGAEHLEGFGSIEGAARAEGEMVADLEPGHTAVLNADDEFLDLWRGMTRARVVTFGVVNAADFSASDIRTSIDADGFVTQFVMNSPGGSQPIELHLAGRHNVLNALCAAAAATAAGASPSDVRTGLATMRPVPGRLQFKTAPSGAWIVDDSYNANPSSMKAGIEVLEGIDARRWMVMGDMGELGEAAEESHGEIGRFAREHRVDRLFATGRLAALAVEAFGPGGEWFADTESLARAVNAELTREVCVLVKGSRSNRLERVVDALVGSPGTHGTH